MGRKPMDITVAKSRIIAAQPSAEFLRFDGDGPITRQRVVRKCGVCHTEWASLVANVLTHGSGCPVCAKRENARARAFAKIDPRAPGFLYRIDSACGKFSKIGFTQNLLKRLGDVECRVPFALGKRMHVIKEGSPFHVFDLEKALILSVESAGFSGFEGATEWLLSEDLDKKLLDM